MQHFLATNLSVDVSHVGPFPSHREGKSSPLQTNTAAVAKETNSKPTKIHSQWKLSPSYPDLKLPFATYRYRVAGFPPHHKCPNWEALLRAADSLPPSQSFRPGEVTSAFRGNNRD